MINEIVNIRVELENIKIELFKEIRILDSRISHLEGYLIGCGQKTKTESKEK